ncbi:glycosyl transferase [soil metagenome]
MTAAGVTGVDFTHLVAMSDGRGTFEHALYTSPRREHGYCTDDMARVLLVTVREPNPSPAVARLAEVALRFLHDARSADGRYRNRMDASGRWLDTPTLEDCWGRAIWGLGNAAAHGRTEWLRRSASAQLAAAARQHSPMLRPTAFAALGAAEVLAVDPHHTTARLLLCDAADRLPAARRSRVWPWPEDRLTYANALLPEAMIAAGSILDRPTLLRRGLSLLGWLLERQTTAGHLSVTPVGGSGRDDVGPAFDQQPIEVAAMADACRRAAAVDDDRRWDEGVAAAVGWFEGRNDGGHVMVDLTTGGGYDGLTPHGPNRNQGAESTLALLSTMQHARRDVVAPW